MDFNPPADARVVTTEELDKEGSDLLLFHGPLLIKGDVTGKIINVLGGGVWVDGDVKNSSIMVYPENFRSLNRETLWPALKRLGTEGVGAYISGSAELCRNIIAPNVAIGKDLIINKQREADPPPTRDGNTVTVKTEISGNGGAFNACGGYFHVAGSVRGNPDVANSLRAVDSIRIGKDAEYVELITEKGPVTVVGSQTGVTVSQANRNTSRTFIINGPNLRIS